MTPLSEKALLRFYQDLFPNQREKAIPKGIAPYPSCFTFDEYSRDHFRIHLHTAVCGRVGDTHEYCAVYESIGEGLNANAIRDARFDGRRELLKIDRAMLVPIIKELQFREGPKVAWSFVWLQSLNKCLSTWRGDLLDVPFLPREIIGNIAEREGDSPIIAARSTFNRQRHRDVIEYAPEVMNEISEDGIRLPVESEPSEAVAEIFVRAVAVGFTDKGFFVRCREESEYFFDRLQVLFRPIELRPSVRKLVHGAPQA